MAADLSMANNKIIHLATLSDANDAVNKSCVDTNKQFLENCLNKSNGR